MLARPILCGLPLLLLACDAGPRTPRAAARAFLAAELRGDRAAVKKLARVPKGTPEDAVDLSIEARLSTESAMRRVQEAAVQRYGAPALGALPGPRTEEDLGAVDVAAMEVDAKTATIRIPGRRPLVLEKGWWSWKVQLLREVPSEAEKQRMRATAARATAAADETIREIQSGAYPDAQRAATAFYSHLFTERTPPPDSQ